MRLPALILRPREERRLLAGHLWVFANEVDTAKTPLTAFAPGDQAVVASARGRPLGVAYVNPGALICARICDRDPATRLDIDFLRRRIEAAVALRDGLYTTRCYRLLSSEGDYLPGLTVDRFHDVFVVQMTTAGMDRLKEEVVAALDDLFPTRAVILRNDAPIRELEGLPRVVETPLGVAPEVLLVEEDGAVLAAPAIGGQKTGWYYDMRPNRESLCRHVAQKRVLDLYAYAGAFGVRAALRGAAEVTCVDSSATACRFAAANAERNGCDNLRVACADAAKFLEAAADAGETYDVVSLDPPPLVKRKKDLLAGLAAYERLNRLALAVLADGGILMTASCSHHVDALALRRAVTKAAGGRYLQILEQGRQGPDHPVHPAMLETEYLHAFILRALPEGA